MWSIVHKEYRQRARGVATLGMIMTYTIILGAVAFFSYAGAYPALTNNIKTAGDVGSAMSIAVFVAQMIMALLLSLSLNASSIASEKDQETFDLLNLTLFRSWEIVYGKFVSSTGFLFILVVTALPMYALAFTFGGVPLEAFWQLAVVVIGMTLFISSLGLLFSLVSDDVRTALSRSFLALFVLGFGTGFFGAALSGSFDTTPPNPVTYWLGTLSLVLNPLWSAIDVFSPIKQHFAWPAPYPVVVPYLVNHGYLWLWSALAQIVIAALVVFVTALVYPRYRASKTGSSA